MAKLSVLLVLCPLLFGIGSVCGSKVKLECPPGYTINATTIYEPQTSAAGKSMMCVRCSSKWIPASSLEVCMDNGFTYLHKPSLYRAGHFRASAYSFGSHRYIVHVPERGGEACSATVVGDSKELKMHPCSECDDLASPAFPANVSWN